MRTCVVPPHGVSRAERVSSGNGWHTTNGVSVVCYTLYGVRRGKSSLPEGKGDLERRESGGCLRTEVSK